MRPTLFSLGRSRRLLQCHGLHLRTKKTDTRLVSILLQPMNMSESIGPQVIQSKDAVIHLTYHPRRPPLKPAAWTRFVCISDSHGETFPLPPGDVLIHAGDLTRNVRGTTILIQNPDYSKNERVPIRNSR